MTLKDIKASKLNTEMIIYKRELQRKLYVVRTVKEFELIDKMIKEIEKKMK